MELEKDVFNALINYLEEHGYPPESLAVEYPVGKYRVDLAVIDPDSKEPIALFEIKQERTPANMKLGRGQLKSFLSSLEVKSIPTYLVFAKVGTPPFEIERILIEEIETTKEKVISTEKVMDFRILQKSARNNLVAETKQKRKKTIDILTGLCLTIASILLVILLLDAFGIIFISPIHLIIGGAIIALVLIPFANKVKILGIEFERLKKEEQSKQ